MKILLGSDFHMEHRLNMPNIIPEMSYYISDDVIILAGDIHTHNNIEKFLTFFCGEFKDSTVIYTTGNHEYYSGRPEHNMETINANIKRLESVIPNLMVGFNDVIEVNGVGFYVGTMWSDLNCPPEFKVVPYHERDLIYKDATTPFSEEVCEDAFKEFKDGLLAFLRDTDYETKVVVSHFSPSLKMGNPHIVAKGLDFYMKYYFSADLDYILDDPELAPDLWVYGHTHYSMDETRESGCRIISSQIGYPKENHIERSMKSITI